MALVPLHEQNNKYLKGVSGATHSVNRQENSALIRWDQNYPDLIGFEEGIEWTRGR